MLYFKKMLLLEDVNVLSYVKMVKLMRTQQEGIARFRN